MCETFFCSFLSSEQLKFIASKHQWCSWSIVFFSEYFLVKTFCGEFEKSTSLFFLQNKKNFFFEKPKFKKNFFFGQNVDAWHVFHSYGRFFFSKFFVCLSCRETNTNKICHMIVVSIATHPEQTMIFVWLLRLPKNKKKKLANKEFRHCVENSFLSCLVVRIKKKLMP